eukprot:gene12048-15482_t
MYIPERHRKYQEDTVQVLPLPNLGRRSISPYAAVFDGHGGSGASELCRDTVHTPVVTEEAARPELSVPLVMSRALRQAGAKFTHTPRRTVFRVYGTLAVSRAVGDKNLQPMARSMNSPLVLLTAEPEVGCAKADVSDLNVLFFIGDGLFDVLEAAGDGAGAGAGAGAGVVLVGLSVVIVVLLQARGVHHLEEIVGTVRTAGLLKSLSVAPDAAVNSATTAPPHAAEATCACALFASPVVQTLLL